MTESLSSGKREADETLQAAGTEPPTAARDDEGVWPPETASANVDTPEHDLATDEQDYQNEAATESGAGTGLADMLANIDLAMFSRLAQLRTEVDGDEIPAPPPIPPPRFGSEEPLQELAEDMLALLTRMKAIEAQNAYVLERLDRIESSVQSASQLSARETDVLRRDLLGERKITSAMGAFNAVVPSLERLRIMHGELHPQQDRRMQEQLVAVTETLSMILRGLGFVEFAALPGEPFDPNRMECLGYAEGNPNVVVRPLRAGFQAQGRVVRPAGVLIAKPNETVSQQSPGDNS